MKTFDGYKKRALTDEYALLAGGGHKPLSDFSTSAHTHSIKINGATKTIAASGGAAVDLGNYKTILTAVTSPTASGTSISFIDTISLNTNGVIAVTKKTVPTMRGATASAAGTVGLVPAPAANLHTLFLKGDGTWATPSDTHWTTHLYIGAKDSASNAATTNGNTYIKVTDNSTIRNQYIIKGAGRATVASDASGNITITSPTVTWSEISGKPSTFTPNAHNHPTSQINALTSYTKATSAASLATTDSLNTALGKLEYKLDVAYNLVTKANDSDGTIENLKEILDVLAGIKDTETIKAIIGKYLPLSGGTLSGGINFSNTSHLLWNSGSYHQRIFLTDDATSDTAVFTFQQSTDSGTNWSNLMTIRDNGKVIANTFIGALSGNADTATALTTSAGSAALPAYFSNGKPVACIPSSIFSNLSNSGNDLSITVAGLSRTLTVGYATLAKSLKHTILTSDLDLNTLTTEGVYSNTQTVICKSLVNGPTNRTNGECRLEVINCGTSGHSLQWLYTKSQTKGEIWYRMGGGSSTWSTWNKIAFTSNIPTSLKNPYTLTFSAGIFAAKTYDGSAAVTVNIPTHTSHLVNNSGFLTSHLSLANYVTLNTALTITGAKTFSNNLTLNASDADRYITFNYTGSTGYDWRIGYLGSGSGDANYFVILSDKTDGTYVNALRIGLTTLASVFGGTVTSSGFIKSNSSNSYVLLGGGGHKALSDFSMAHSHPYLPLAGGTMNQGSHVIFPGTSTNTDYGGSIEFREVNYVTTSQTDWSYAPGITFHWGGRTVGKLGLRSDGNLAWRNYNIIHSGNISSQSVNYANSAGSVAWANITGKPTTFNPSAHTHTLLSITNKVVAGNEFNFLPSTFASTSLWFNYLPENDRNTKLSLNEYYFGNGGLSYAYLKAAGYRKNGSNNNYLLLGGGGHKAISDFSMAHSHPYLPLSAGSSNILTGDLYITRGNTIRFGTSYATSNTWDLTTVGANTGISVLDTIGKSSAGAPSTYAVGISISGYYGMQIAAYGGGNSEEFWIRNNKNTWRTLLHSGNWSTYCAAASHTHTKSLITDFPSSLPANGGNADTVDGYHAGFKNNQVSVYAPFPNWDDLKSKGFINSNYGTSGYGHPDEEFLKGICKWAIATYPNNGDITLMGKISPNSSGTCILHLYSSSGKDSTTLLPRYCRGQYMRLDGTLSQFGTDNYVWSYNSFAHSGNGYTYFTTFSGGGISSSGNTLTQANHSITIGGQTRTAGSSSCNIINSLSVSKATSSAVTNLTLGITVNGIVSSDKTITNLHATCLNNTSVSNPADASCTLNKQGVLWFSLISLTSGYAGNNYGFPASNNANGILYLGTHALSTANAYYGGQLGVSSNSRLYYRFSNGSSWSTAANGGSWKTIAWTSDIPTVTNYYWANIKVSASSSTTTTPAVASLSITGDANTRGIQFPGGAWLNSIGKQVILRDGNLRFGGSGWDWNQWAGLKYDYTTKKLYLGIPDGTIFNANSAVTGGYIGFPGIAMYNLGREAKVDADFNAHYGTTASPGGWYKIKINPETSWMLSFTIRLYQSYTSADILIQGYNYGGNYWYSPNALIIGGTYTSIAVKFGYDKAYGLWVAVPAASYTGISILGANNGFTQTDWYNGFTITNVAEASLTTVLTTITAYRPWYRNETVSNATNSTYADYAYRLRINSANSWSNWYWSGQSGQPTWLWGSNDGTNMYVWNPSNFSVNYANSAGNADTVDGQHFNWSNNRDDHSYLWAASSNGQAYLVHRASMSVNYANYSGYSQKLLVHDVRSATRTPNYFDGKRVTAWFNNTGTPDGDWWSGIHVKGWDSGYASWELCSYSSTGTGNDYNLYFRNGNNTSWGNWKTILTSSNYTSYINATNFPGLNKSGTVTSITVTGSNGLSGSGTVTTSGTITLSNSGVRSTTINGNYLRVNTNGTNADLTIPYATNADKLDGYHASSFALSGHTHSNYLPLSGGTMNNNARISHNGNLYIGRSDNGGWVLCLDMCSLSSTGDTYWSLRTSGTLKVKFVYLDIIYPKTSAVKVLGLMAVGDNSFSAKTGYWLSSQSIYVGNENKTEFFDLSGDGMHVIHPLPHIDFYKGKSSVDGNYTLRLIEITEGRLTLESATTTPSLLLAGNIYASGYYESSDITLKTNFSKISTTIEQISNLPVFDFSWKENLSSRNTGTSAQAVQTILPNIVTESSGSLKLNYGVLGTVAGIIACKELVIQKSEIEQLRERVIELEKQLNEYISIYKD